MCTGCSGAVTSSGCSRRKPLLPPVMMAQVRSDQVGTLCVVKGTAFA